MIAVVLVNYKGAADSIECLEALLRLAGENWRFIVVDNASGDGSIERLADWAAGRAPFERPAGAPWNTLPAERRRAPEFNMLDAAAAAGRAPTTLITLIASPANLGFAGANNIGMRYALNDPDCSHVWLLNNDTVVDPAAGAELMAAALADPQIGILAATLLYYHAPDTVQATGAYYNLLLAGGTQLNHMASRHDDLDPAQVAARLTYVPGASMLVSRAFIEAVGPMNERYFLYYEELDWALRGKGRFRQGWAPRAIVYHKEGGSIGTSTTARTSDRSIFYMTRALLRFYRQRQPLLLPVPLIRTLLRLLRYALVGDVGRAKAIIAALRGWW